MGEDQLMMSQFSVFVVTARRGTTVPNYVLYDVLNLLFLKFDASIVTAPNQWLFNNIILVTYAVQLRTVIVGNDCQLIREGKRRQIFYSFAFLFLWLALAQTVSRRPVTVEVRVWSQASPCGISWWTAWYWDGTYMYVQLYPMKQTEIKSTSPVTGRA